MRGNACAEPARSSTPARMSMMNRLLLCSLLVSLAPFRVMATDANAEDAARFAQALALGLRPSTAPMGAALPR
ncbi:hypothetical protein, partial [Klebsiella pneumoniae]|uniref:hypothetical protein n=1 Tax=Klebsiella pneumoniae TaxID=573 RepID=UPI001CD38247